MKRDKAVLAVSFGTSHLETIQKTIGAIEEEIQEAFPEFEVYRAFTSEMIRRKLKKRDGLDVSNVKEAMERMRRDGIEDVIVQPTYVINGTEYDIMKKELAGYQGVFKSMRVGKPLLTCPQDYKEAAKAVLEENTLGPKEMLLLVGHGTEHHANAAYPTLEYMFHLLGHPQVLVGTVEGFPKLRDVLERLAVLKAERVVLMPFLIVAGDHVKNDMAGGEGSWESILKEAGYEVKTVIRGLGEVPGIRKLFVRHAKEA
ncbi:MAG: sirohydrochlorin cobaltochelatase [Coprococcus sp.]|nr:sirohydrochlorin cobaltochelatase [Coprococcus sp.]